MTQTQVTVFTDKKVRVGGSYKEFVKYMKDNDINPVEPEIFWTPLREAVDSKETLVVQQKMLKTMTKDWKKTLKVVNRTNRDSIQCERDDAVLKLVVAKKRYEDLVSRFVSLREETATLKSMKASQFLIEHQITQQQLVEGRSEETDPAKEKLKESLRNSKEMMASMEQELRAKSRSWNRMRTKSHRR